MTSNAERSEVVDRWLGSGLLRGVRAQHLIRAAMRIDAAWRRTLGGSDRSALDKELALMDREGLFNG